MNSEIIYQGAEALIFRRDNKIIKRRIKKSYRISELDEKIREQRTRREKKILLKASNVVNVPKVFDEEKDKFEIVLEFINGEKLSEILDGFDIFKKKEIVFLLGKELAKLHNSDIIHGDLTTSNIILKEDKIYFIDFGLSFFSKKIEDKAVDIHLFKQALEAKHWKNWESLFKSFLEGYSQESNDFERIFERLKKVEKRGRYKGGF
ncbi:MAG: KEOPS complex kinase/ATPase Bud32 [Candidatus Pacearchaeota archaeon]